MSPKNNKSRNTNLNETQKIHHNQILIQENEGKKNSDGKSNPSIVDLKRLMEVVFVLMIEVEPGGSIPSHKVSWQWHGGCGPRLRWRRRLVVVKGYLIFYFFLFFIYIFMFAFSHKQNIWMKKSKQKKKKKKKNYWVCVWISLILLKLKNYYWKYCR